jgi:predicted lipoprotein with Yx(FWY)xxD motif
MTSTARKLSPLAVLAAAAFVAATTGVFAQSMPAKSGSTDKGEALVDGKGMTLYTFGKDTAGKSACNGQCATNWPPLAAKAGDAASGDWSVVTRDDGSAQWAFKGRPLYTFIKDKKPGDAVGDGVMNGAWMLAKP